MRDGERWGAGAKENKSAPKRVSGGKIMFIKNRKTNTHEKIFCVQLQTRTS